MIVNLLPKQNELIEQSIIFNESMRGFGYKCRVLIPDSVELPDIGYHQDIGYNEDNALDAYISIDPHPKPKLLQNLGWDIESEDTKPMICYIAKYIQPIDKPRDVNTESIKVVPTKYTRLTLEYDYEDKGKEFIVTKVSSNSFNPIYHIIMIVPYRPTVPDNVDPLNDHNLDKLKVQETDSQFRFIGTDRLKEVEIKY